MSLPELVDAVSKALTRQGKMLVTAESCTGGLIAQLITDRAGSSSVFERGYVTYSNDAKMECLGVSHDTLSTHGAVSEKTAREMAAGALHHSRADIAISVTGVAGPGGGTDDKPVGLVYIGLAQGQDIKAHEYHFDGTRSDIRTQTAEAALRQVLETLSV